MAYIADYEGNVYSTLCLLLNRLAWSATSEFFFVEMSRLGFSRTGRIQNQLEFLVSTLCPGSVRSGLLDGHGWFCGKAELEANPDNVFFWPYPAVSRCVRERGHSLSWMAG